VEPRVEIAQGTAYDLLMSAAAVADPRWRATFDVGSVTYERVRSAVGDDVVRRIAAYGRFGWINLVGLRPAGPAPWSLSGLAEEVRRTEPQRLHLVMLGGERRQLVEAVGGAVLKRAIAGEPAARTVLRAALGSDALVVDATAELVDASSGHVHADVVDLVETWRRAVLPATAEAALATTLRRQADAAERLLAASPGRGYLDVVIGGLTYQPAGLDRVVSVSSPQVSPVVVVVDGLRETVIVHPPLDEATAEPGDADRLLQLGRAVGDRTRLQILSRLRDGPLKAVELAEAMGAPRTTLLHHLAILRAAGFVHVTVTPGDATVYRLRPRGFTELSLAAGSFIPSR
jgi:DNA-binding transcriptional ArsR family regulator